MEAQKQICEEQEAYLEPNNQIKVNCHVRFIGLPPPDPRYKLPFPNYSQIGQFREIRGNVIRMSQMKLLELKRDFVCSQCKQILTIDADYSLMYRFDAPRNCEKDGCKGQIYQKSQEPLPEYCVYYQELKVQVIHSMIYDNCERVNTNHFLMNLNVIGLGQREKYTTDDSCNFGQ